MRCVKAAATLIVMAALCGCSLGEKRFLALGQYTIEYPPPVFERYTAIDSVIRIGLFSSSAGFDSPAMVYRTEPFKRNVYFYDRWRVNPGDMVREALIRDMESSGLFRAVFSDAGYEGAGGLVLRGRVEEFIEVDDGGGSRASLVIDAILLDLRGKEHGKTMLFQKQYRSEEPIENKTAAAFAKGMSAAMEALSRRLIADVYESAKKN